MKSWPHTYTDSVYAIDYGIKKFIHAKRRLQNSIASKLKKTRYILYAQIRAIVDRIKNLETI